MTSYRGLADWAKMMYRHATDQKSKQSGVTHLSLYKGSYCSYVVKQ